MTNKQLARKMEESDMSPRTFLVYNCLLKHCNKKNRCCVDTKTIARETRYSVDTVRRAVRELIATGWLTRTIRYDKTTGEGQMYVFYELKCPEL